MKNIFKNAKFGDVFVCRNGWRLLFVTKDEEKALLLRRKIAYTIIICQER